MVMEMQHTYEEQQSNVDDMIRQVALLTEMMKEIKESRAKSEVDGNNEEEEGVRKAEEEESADAEEESEALLEKAKAVEIDSDEEEMQPEGKSMTTPPDDETPRENLEEASDEPSEKEEAIECDEEIDNTLFYLQPEKVHEPDEKVEEFTTVVKEERTPEERPPPVIDKSEGCYYEEEEPECEEEERSRRKAARAVYWVQLQPWPEPLRMGKPPHSGVRPKENKKVQGIYRHHRKKWGAMLVMIPQKIRWIAKRKVESEFPSNDCSQEGY